MLRWLLCCRQVTRVVLLWVNNHFNDFETDPAMSDFLETFEKLLENQVSDAAAKWIAWHVWGGWWVRGVIAQSAACFSLLLCSYFCDWG